MIEEKEVKKDFLITPDRYLFFSDVEILEIRFLKIFSIEFPLFKNVHYNNKK